MSEIIRIGIDVAKTVFQLHGVDGSERAVDRRRLRRGEVLRHLSGVPGCVVVLEACGSAHHWGRSIGALGHEVRLVPPVYAKAYVKRNKTDAADAAAICEAGGRPDMRFVPVKSLAEQAAAGAQRVRETLVQTRTALVNSLRGQLAEFGLTAPKGIENLPILKAHVTESPPEVLPDLIRQALAAMIETIEGVATRIAAQDREMRARVRSDAAGRRLMEIPGIGPITAAALMAKLPDPSRFRSGRHFAAWLGLTPRATSSGETRRLGGISKAGDGMLRTLLVLGATALMRSLRRSEAAAQTPLGQWLQALVQRGKRPKVVAVALANKLARIAWAVMARGEPYTPERLAPGPTEPVRAAA